MIIATISSAGSVMLYHRSHIVPYVVAIDSLGKVVAQGPVQETPIQNEAVVKAGINDFVINMRQVVADRNAESRSIDRVYSMLAQGSQAEHYLNTYFHEHSPYDRATNETVAVEVGTILPVSQNTYEVTWAEKVYTHQGELIPDESHRWKGSFTFAINPPKDEQISRYNPIGVFVSDLTWSQDAIQEANADTRKSAQ
jgi:type IV secretion system protein VirB5